MMYESEITKFMRELLQRNPELRELQKKNRATWWDKKPDREQQSRFEQSNIGVNGYAYFPIPDVPKTPEKS